MASDLVIVPATTKLAKRLAVRMRADDAAEVMAAAGQEPLAAILESVRLSCYSRAALLDGEPMAIWGIADLGEHQKGLGGAWALTSDLVDRYPRVFLNAAREELTRLFERWTVLTNVVDCRYERAIRWLSRYGANFSEPMPVGPQSMPFRQFTLRREDFFGGRDHVVANAERGA